MNVPAITECKSLADVRAQSRAITKMATDIVAEPIVQTGYMMSNQSGQTAFINIMSMAKKRLTKLFPAADWTDPLYERLMAEAKYICAQCIHLKYECRERRQPYDHLKDATIRIEKMVRDMFNTYADTVNMLEGGHAISQQTSST